MENTNQKKQISIAVTRVVLSILIIIGITAISSLFDQKADAPTGKPDKFNK
ncbi:hypothetical protein [Candidatus Nitrosocosmicus sp. SS]|jgi:hypothetical protein|uniref:hypothetical protein n=1 Tax=Candidatus Nitrosocosmicus agrestis TaxID=2563600 RepID=UPI0012B65463|nr:hypothetical protein [Candidatus Nitrosocosmicus sp. SS]